MVRPLSSEKGHKTTSRKSNVEISGGLKGLLNDNPDLYLLQVRCSRCHRLLGVAGLLADMVFGTAVFARDFANKLEQFHRNSTGCRENPTRDSTTEGPGGNREAKNKAGIEVRAGLENPSAGATAPTYASKGLWPESLSGEGVSTP